MAAALAYTVVATAVGVGLHRRARVSLPAVALLALLPLLLTGQALLHGGVYGSIDLAYTSEPLASIAESAGVTRVGNPVNSDVYTEFIPWHAAVRDAIRHHQWPLWDRFSLSGTVLAAAVQSAPYHPLHLIALLLPMPAALTFLAAMLFFVAAVSMFLFVRPMVSSEAPALLAAAIWMLAPHVGGFALTAYALALSTAPLVLLAARLLAHEPSMRHAILLAALLAVTILAGHPETTLHIVTVAVAYFFFEHRFRRSRAIRLGLLAGVLALLIAAISLLPFIEAARQTKEYQDRETFVHQSWKLGRSLRAARDSLLPAPLAHFRSDPAEVPGTAYAGSIALALAVAGAIRRRAWFFIALFAFGLLAAVRAVMFADVLHVLPLYSIAANEHLAWCCAFALAVLAAFGLEKPTAIVFLAVAVLIAIAALPVFDLRALLPLVLCGAAAFWPRGGEGAAAPLRTMFVILALFLVQRGGETAPFRTWVPRSAFYPRFPGVEMLRADEPFRIVGQRSLLPPNIATHYGLEDARGYAAMTLERYAALEPFWSMPQPTWSNRVETLDSPFLSLMNVRFALAKHGEAIPPEWRVVKQFDAYDVVENTRVLPRAFVPASAHTGITRGEAFHGVQLCNDFGAEAWIEGGERGSGSNGPGVITLREAGSKLDMRASMANDGWIVISESAWNGWHATVDGNDARVRIADSTFLGVHVPKGEHHVRLVYRPLSFVVGAGISAATLLALAAIVFLRK
ncbi:MAG TPA: YfhO family protein [Thermoanaerobaculia bacterium]